MSTAAPDDARLDHLSDRCRMTHRLFIAPPVADRSSPVRLEGSEAHHLIHVMRARPGHRLTLFDGSGSEFEAEVESIGRDAAMCTVVEVRHIDRESPVATTLAAALPKGDRLKQLVEKAVEVGVRRLVPLACEYGQWRWSPALRRRLERGVIEASKQCGRNRLMAIDAPARFDDPRLAPGDGIERWIAHPASATPATSCDRPQHSSGDRPMQRGTGSRERIVAIGPEGGFSPSEVEQAVTGGWRTLDLGPRILRTETAAVVAVIRLTADDQTLSKTTPAD